MVESMKTDKKLKSKKLAIGKSIQQLQSSLLPVKVYDKAAIQKNIELMKSKISLSTTTNGSILRFLCSYNNWFPLQLMSLTKSV